MLAYVCENIEKREKISTHFEYVRQRVDINIDVLGTSTTLVQCRDLH